MIQEIWDAGQSKFRLRTEVLERIRYRPYGYAERQLLADTNGNGSVDLEDLDRIITTFGLGIGSPGYAAEMDTDSNGAVDLQDLDAVINTFGTLAPTDGSLWLNAPGMVGYGGGLYDELAGLYLFRNRYYDPTEGRWITRDPAGYVDGLNLYQYVQGNPLMYFDPFGLRRGPGGMGTERNMMPREYRDRSVHTVPRSNYNAGKCVEPVDDAVNFLNHELLHYLNLHLPTNAQLNASVDHSIERASILGEAYGDNVLGYTRAALGELTGMNEFAEMGVGFGLVENRDLTDQEIADRAVSGTLKLAGLTGPGAMRLGGGIKTPITTGGRYSDLIDHPSVAPGKAYTSAQKKKIREFNSSMNDGNLQSDMSGMSLRLPKQHTKGVTPPKNEAHIDHIVPRSEGGSNSYSNAQVLSREENLKKGNKR